MCARLVARPPRRARRAGGLCSGCIREHPLRRLTPAYGLTAYAGLRGLTPAGRGRGSYVNKSHIFVYAPYTRACSLCALPVCAV